MQTNSKLQTAKHMALGALLLVICSILIWSISNFDVLVKAFRYPDAIRELDITIQVEKPEIVSPVAGSEDIKE